MIVIVLLCLATTDGAGKLSAGKGRGTIDNRACRKNSWSRLFVLEGNRVIAVYIAASETLFEAAAGVPDKFMGRGCVFGYYAAASAERIQN